MAEGAFALTAACWLKKHLEKLSDLVGGSTDFGALAGVTNFARFLVNKGCTHVEEIQAEVFDNSFSVGVLSRPIRRSVRNFMISFWSLFGRDYARVMAEKKRSEVRFVCLSLDPFAEALLPVFVCFCFSVLISCLL